MTRSSRLLVAALFLVPACSPSPEREPSPEQPGSAAAGKPAQPPATSAPTTASDAGTEPTRPAESGGVPPAIQELKEKLQPRPAAEIPDDKTLVVQAKAFATRFVELCGAGDVEGAKQMAFSAKDFEEALTPGSRDILEGSLSAQNNAIIERLASLLAGKKLTAELQPGGLVRAASSTYRNAPPMLSDSVLAIDVNGTPIEVRFDQLVYTGGGWKILQITAP